MKGITLIEVLVTSLIGVIVLTGITMYLNETARTESAITLQSQAHSALYLSSRQIEEEVKQAAFVEVSPDSKILKLFNQSDLLLYKYTLANGKLYKAIGTADSSEVIPFVETDFTGSSFSAIDVTTISFDFNLLVSNRYGEYQTGYMSYYIQCRNKKILLAGGGL